MGNLQGGGTWLQTPKSEENPWGLRAIFDIDSPLLLVDLYHRILSVV
jgi:hypothetical protein